MEYPTSSTIPFPFKQGPYPQQAALMDTMLQSLQIVDDEQQRQQQEMMELEINQSGHNETILKSRKRRANVMMLESPTGTGKSLSLACASLAWLRYREKMDLLLLQGNNESVDESNDVIRTNNSLEGQKQQSTCSNKGDENCIDHNAAQTSKNSWLDEWIPPEQIEKQKQLKQRQDECYHRASESRNELHKELQCIRHRVLKRYQARERKEMSNNQKLRGKKDHLMKNVREEVVKESIDNLRFNEQSLNHRDSAHISRKKKPMKQSEENDFCLEEYKSDIEIGTNHGYTSSSDEENNQSRTLTEVSRVSNGNQDDIKYSALTLLDGGRLDGSGIATYNQRIVNKSKVNASTHSIGGCEPGSGVRKIIYAARTHSQLSQFVSEVHRTAWGSDVRIVALGGRKMLCGNTDVTGEKKNRSEAMITEKCLDLQKGLVDKSKEATVNDKNQSDNVKKRKKAKNSKNACPLMSSKEAISTLALHMLAKPSDIEDLVGLGEKSQTCAYYASRESLKAAEVVVVPYNTLLSKSARNAVGLSLRSSLVIIDEAHNIPEALRTLSSCQLTLPIIEGANSQLRAYVTRYASRLTGRNITYLTQIQKILVAFTKHLKSKNTKINPKRAENRLSSNTMVTATELLFAMKLDNINLFNILKYLEHSRLSQKLHGFTNSISGENGEKELDFDDPNFISKHISCMSLVETFLQCLCGTEREGRVVVDVPNIEESSNLEIRKSTSLHPCFRYLLLDPSVHFKDIVDEAHAIVLAGGTLRPFPHVATELFGDDRTMVINALTSENEVQRKKEVLTHSSISRELTTFCCGHVISTNNVIVTCLSGGPNNTALDFRHCSRSAEKICNELGEACIEVSKVIPSGLVIFFPSYTYEAHVVQHWKKCGLYDKINMQKRIFREPKSASEVENTLGMYSKSAVTNGAILLCVINGKMSEGINFADDICRGVLLCGLPFPDITDSILQEKMQLLDKEFKKNKMSITGQAYYENLCMRSVNQSIGRAIRHINDYAAIMLADVRYSTDFKIWNKLPLWLRSGKEIPKKTSFDENIQDIMAFFHSIENRSQSLG